MLPGKLRRKHYGRLPFNRRVAAMVRKARGLGRPVAGSARSRSVGDSRADLVSALVNLGYEKSTAKQAAAAASGSDFDTQLRDALHLLKKNPRVRAITMQKKRKKRNKMPAGLAGYWRKKRAKKNSRRRKNAGRRRNLLEKIPGTRAYKQRKYKTSLTVDALARRLQKSLAEVGDKMTLEEAKDFVRKKKGLKKSNPRKRKTSRRRRNRRNPVRPRMVRPPFRMTAGQLKKYARALARATGKRVQIKSR